MGRDESQSDQSLLITGGTGFIGRFLIPELVKSGWQVVVWSRQDPSSVRRIAGESVLSISALEDWPFDHGPKACVNLAGAGIMDKRWSAARKLVLRDSRIGLTQQLVQWLNKQPQPPLVFLSGSAVGYYGAKESLYKLVEGDPSGLDFAARLCADWEHAASQVSSATRLCLLRTGIVLHPGYGALKKMLPAFRLGLGGPVGRGDQMMSWIHIGDMTAAILHLLNKPEVSGPFNVVAPEAVTNRAFAQALGQLLHRPAVFPAPAPAVRLALGEAAQLLLEGQHPIPQALEGSGFHFAFPDLKTALADLL